MNKFGVGTGRLKMPGVGERESTENQPLVLCSGQSPLGQETDPSPGLLGQSPGLVVFAVASPSTHSHLC